MGGAQTNTATLRIGGELKAITSLPGSGTSADPYRIEGSEISPAASIALENSPHYVLIRGVTTVGAGPQGAISIFNSTNVVIEGADIQFGNVGIRLTKANGTIVRDSAVRTSAVGIVIEGTSGARISNNKLAVNGQDIVLQNWSAPGRVPSTFASVGNVFRDNNLSIATGQVGLFFGNISNYENDIDASNVVNFVPVRWYVRASGTPAEFRIITGDEAYVKGMTNVGQIVCYLCSHVRFENVNASLGAASGLLMEQSHNVTIRNAFAEGNDAAGIHILNSSDVRVEGSSVYANRVGVRAFNVARANISELTAATNERGVQIESGANNTIRASRIASNSQDGVVLERTTRVTTGGNTITGNGVDGIRITAGVSHMIRGETIRGNGGMGVSIIERASFSNTVTESLVENNAKGGIVLGKETLLNKVVGNTVTGNGEGGIRFVSSGAANRVESNILSGQPRHIRVTSAQGNEISGNNMTSAPGETGLWFDDETSYLNTVSTTNLVGGTAVQWHVALAGTPNNPIVLRGIRVETPNMTNIAQVMLYKGSYVRIEDTHATDGTRGIYALKSSSVVVQGAEIARNVVGVEFDGTQTGAIRDVIANGGKNAVLLANTLNVTVSAISAPNVLVAVEIKDLASRGSVIERINATGTQQASVRDPSSTTREPRHLIADAGLDKLAGQGSNVTFSDATGVARFGSERIVRQSWDFGDGNTTQSAETATLRPTHLYNISGNLTATYSIETADGLALSDTVRVRIVPPSEAPAALKAAEAARNAIELKWDPPPSEFPITKYKVYRGLDPNNLTLLLETVNNATTTQEKFEKAMTVWYAISATSFGGESVLSDPVAYKYRPPPPPPEPEPPTTNTTGEEAKGSPMPAPVLVALAIGVAALLVRRRRS